MIPYGNEGYLDKEFFCDHGPLECKKNMVESCAIEHLKTPEDYMPFLFCAEAAEKITPDAVIRKCVRSESIASAISTCYGGGKGEEGIRLQIALGERNEKLKNKYTPWIVINGEHSNLAEDHLERAICLAYTGSHTPAACGNYIDRRCFPVKLVHSTDIIA